MTQLQQPLVKVKVKHISPQNRSKTGEMRDSELCEEIKYMNLTHKLILYKPSELCGSEYVYVQKETENRSYHLLN